MKILAIIIARAGSAGVKNKNMLQLCGKPVVWYTIRHAKTSHLIDTIAVTTDSTEILEIAKDSGLHCIERPAHLATATARVDGAVIHAVKTLEKRGMGLPEIVVLLYGNVPVREKGIIDKTVRHLIETDADSVRTFCDVGKRHPLWMSKIDGDKVTPYIELNIFRRQDLPKLYYHDGGVVAISCKTLLESEKSPDDPFAFFGKDIRAVICEEGANIEIDSPKDIALAEAVIMRQNALNSDKVTS